MFNSLGWGEILFLVVFGLVIFGPDKLPGLARDAARALRQVREVAQGARTQIKTELGPEFADLDLESLNPRTFVRKHLLEDSDGSDPFGMNLFGDDDESPAGRADPVPAISLQKPLATGELAPYDRDAT